MRSQRWIVLVAMVLAALIGVAIAGVPHSQEDLHLKPLPPTTTAPPAGGITSSPGGSTSTTAL
ncbi:MAG: hypothetical protein ACR2MB_16715 [Acidimicrobiales bacterium]